MTGKTWTIKVPGKPQPAGSKRAYPFRRGDGRLGVHVTDDNPKAVDWKAAVRHEARLVYDGLPLEGGVRVSFIFSAPRPKSHYRTGSHAGELKPNAPMHPITKPDALKLARGTEDALTGIIWRDDAQVVHGSQHKRFGDRYETIIEIEDLGA